MGLLSGDINFSPDFENPVDLGTIHVSDQVSAVRDQMTQGLSTRVADVSFEPQRLGVFTSQDFGTRTAKIWCGLVGDLSELEYPYKVKITSSKLNWGIVAALQDRTSLRVSSDWEPIIPRGLTGLGMRLGALTQLALGKALYTKWMTRRIWVGTSPLQMTMNLLFVSINNTKLNVMYPCMILQQLVLPSADKNAPVTGLLSPPGPSPFYLGEEESPLTLPPSIREHITKHSEFITVSIGDFLRFEKVIVQDVNVTFDSRMSVDGFPISASVDVVFQTYEILTKETLQDAYLGKVRTL